VPPSKHRAGSGPWRGRNRREPAALARTRRTRRAADLRGDVAAVVRLHLDQQPRASSRQQEPQRMHRTAVHRQRGFPAAAQGAGGPERGGHAKFGQDPRSWHGWSRSSAVGTVPVASAEFLFQTADHPGTAEGQEGARRAARTNHTGCAAHTGRADPSACAGRTGGAPGICTGGTPGTCTGDAAGHRAACARRRGASATRVGAVTGRLLEFLPPVIGASQPGLQR